MGGGGVWYSLFIKKVSPLFISLKILGYSLNYTQSRLSSQALSNMRLEINIAVVITICYRHVVIYV